MSNRVRFLDLVRPAMGLIPEVEQPMKKVSYHPSNLPKLAFNDKMLWTSIVLFIYLICCQVPIYGVYK